MTRRVLITGVSSGIGLAQARLFLENGYQVYGVDQGENPLLEGDFHFLQRDLILDLKPVFDWCPQVDVLCNTAEFWMLTNPYWNNQPRKFKRFLKSTI